MPNFNFLKKGLEVVSLPHFMYDFSRKKLLTDRISLPNCKRIYLCIAIAC